MYYIWANTALHLIEYGPQNFHFIADKLSTVIFWVYVSSTVRCDKVFEIYIYNGSKKAIPLHPPFYMHSKNKIILVQILFHPRRALTQIAHSCWYAIYSRTIICCMCFNMHTHTLTFGQTDFLGTIAEGIVTRTDGDNTHRTLPLGE